MTRSYQVDDQVVFRSDKTTRVGTLKRIIPSVDKRSRDTTKAVLETTFVDMTGTEHVSVATVLYRAILCLAKKDEVAQ